ncbi:MAG: ABC transporter ATP-binding protein [Firmicutes bacterium]|nr:ABC transporter ATP-binding protein [Bacillota bacterium]
MQLQIHGITVSYRGREVLTDLSLEVRQGDFVAIVGPNGSGKTTLLRTISRVLRPERGVVLLTGEDLNKFSQRQIARRLGVVPQASVAVPDFTVEEMVMLGRSPHQGRLQGESRRDLEVVRQALRLTGSLELRDRLFNELSGGEKSILVIARALAQEPELLLLDEPTSHLDINYQREILQLLRGLSAKQGLTVISVLHDLNLASHFAQRLIMLQDGLIQSAGTPREVLTPENIWQVYRTEVLVIPHIATGQPLVLLPAPREEEIIPAAGLKSLKTRERKPDCRAAGA